MAVKERAVHIIKHKHKRKHNPTLYMY